jgi:hypothetical protein
MTRFLLLMRDGGRPQPPEATGGTEADWQAWQEFEQSLRAAGAYVDGGELAAAGEGVVVRTELDGVAAADAVVARTAPVPAVTAWYLVEAADADAAIGWARRLPTRLDVEVRAERSYDFG